MTYQVLARKWRPQDFSSLVGQEHVVRALGNALTEQRVAQAYLFSGIRGVGKTTAARVFAKALNCERSPTADPCNECASCLEITAGHSLDVVEVDAATYSKVEQVRELTETLRYAPARGPYKVVVLDEVHRLSRQAFDALLKIVEEPPAHLVFIFATTEIDAVPATILSRCQEFQFRRVTQPVLAGHLRAISEAEEISVSDAALRMIARAGEGSVRDSVALLDQMATFGSGTISDDDAQRVLGGLDTAIFQQLMVAILTGKRSDIVATVRDIEANGWDPHNVYSQFLTFLRDALHLTLSGGEGTSELPADEAALLRKNLEGHGYEAVLQVLQLLITSEPTVRRSEFSLLALEIAWLRAAELPRVSRLQDLLSANGGSASPAPSGGGGDRPESGASGSIARSAGAPPKTLERPPASSSGLPPAPQPADSTETKDPQPAPRPVAPKPRAAERRPVKPRAVKTQPDGAAETGQSASPTAIESSGPTCDPARIPHFLELLANRRQSLAAHFERAGLRFDRRCLLIAAPEGDSLFLKAVNRPTNVATLEQALSQVWGDGVTWKIDPHAVAPPRPQRVDDVDMRRSAPPRTAMPPAARNPDRAPRSSQTPPEAPPPEPKYVQSQMLPPGPEPTSAPPSWDDAPPWAGPETGAGQSSVSPEQAAEVSDLPVVRYILSTFGGKIQSVEAASEDSSQ
ncbi:MAG: DNA polymerase III subunit gamma/tau [Acidobacteriota bacterium]